MRSCVLWSPLCKADSEGTTVSHCSDLVGPNGMVYAVEFSHRSGESVKRVSGMNEWGVMQGVIY